MKILTATIASAIAALAGGGGAHAHIVFTQPGAQPGANYTGALRVTHGCGASATTSVTVTLPPGVASAKPQHKAGWSLRIDREPLATPLKGEGGALVRERVTSFTWTGRLPDDEFDEFGINLRLPQAPGPLYFPVVQTCETGENAWVEIPPAGKPWNSVPHPAPVLNLAPAAAHDMAMPGMGEHQH